MFGDVLSSTIIFPSCSYVCRWYGYSPLASLCLHWQWWPCGLCPTSHYPLQIGGIYHKSWRGILKAPKCLIYFLSFKYVRGRAKLKSLRDLPGPLSWIADDGRLLLSHITKPQPQGPDVPIVTHDVSTASKMLGVHFSPSGQSTTHISQMVQRGLDWIDCLCTKPLIQQDVWTSFYMQLYPAISWGLVTPVLLPTTIEKKV